MTYIVKQSLAEHGVIGRSAFLGLESTQYILATQPISQSTHCDAHEQYAVPH
jgi:hypothetical protein